MKQLISKWKVKDGKLVAVWKNSKVKKHLKRRLRDN